MQPTVCLLCLLRRVLQPTPCPSAVLRVRNGLPFWVGGGNEDVGNSDALGLVDDMLAGMEDVRLQQALLADGQHRRPRCGLVMIGHDMAELPGA